MMRRLLLTGGTGFFGKSILSLYAEGKFEKYEFHILSRDPDGFCSRFPEITRKKNIHFLRGDVRSFDFPHEHFDAVIHAATPAMHMPPGEQRDIILKGNERILAFAKKNGGRILFTSSGAVYGPQPPDLDAFPESFPCSPVTEYGIAKKEAEDQFLSSGTDCVIARCFAFTGPYLRRDIHFAIGNFIRDALAGTPIVIQGDGTPLRSYLYADDLAEWLFACLESGTSCGIYNIGSAHPVSIAELALKVKTVLNSSSPIEIRGKPDPDLPVQKYIPSVRKIKSELKVSENFTLEEAIRLSC